jgi:hypothetical protein
MQKYDEEKQVMKARENQLLNLIAEYNQKDDPWCKHVLHYQEQILQQAEKLARMQKAHPPPPSIRSSSGNTTT